MSLTIDGPAELPALYRSADRESQRAQRSYLRSLRARLGALLVAAFGGALTLTTAGGFHIGGGLAFSRFRLRAGCGTLSRHDKPPHNLVRGKGRGGVSQDPRLAIHAVEARTALRQAQGAFADRRFGGTRARGASLKDVAT
jgi:hypothetical protein